MKTGTRIGLAMVNPVGDKISNGVKKIVHPIKERQRLKTE
jgi:hypothetical protein